MITTNMEFNQPYKLGIGTLIVLLSTRTKIKWAKGSRTQKYQEAIYLSQVKSGQRISLVKKLDNV